ncbi:MAG: DegT/DnrJ/EryC1/StrS family aminotransferase [Candidatus Omnitrophica bacterium]|nr:DegT/DnrJ/EryC1/StrS family aminotransferase [Candidatus Omnitrophota bacterium]
MKIPFEAEDRKRYFGLLEKVFDSNFWSEGSMVTEFESRFGKYTGMKALAVTNGGAALLALLEYAGVRDSEVIVPANTFMATPLAVQWAGGKVVFCDCNREDLCMSAKDLERRITKNTKAVMVVHIGGHIAFDILKIKEICDANKIALLEDCAHAHGAEFNGRMAGSFGLGGAYSFYATKTMTTGEGGMVVTGDERVYDFVKKFRNYGKFDYRIRAFNFRLNEFTAALGLVQLERLPQVLEWKKALAAKYDEIFPERVKFPKGMKSGYYKYIAFAKKLKIETGKVYGELCHEFMGVKGGFPNSEWIKANHVCPPIYHGWEHADLPAKALAEKLM